MALRPERQPHPHSVHPHIMVIPVPDNWPFLSPEEITAWRNEPAEPEEVDNEEADNPIIVKPSS